MGSPNIDKDAFIKELLIESMELYLRSHQRLDGESWNTLIEHAPLIAEKVADAHGMTRGEFRKYIAEKGGIKLDQLKRAILKI
jgi:hypothetical protein